eukprot:IDg14449t1
MTNSDFPLIPQLLSVSSCIGTAEGSSVFFVVMVDFCGPSALPTSAVADCSASYRVAVASMVEIHSCAVPGQSFGNTALERDLYFSQTLFALGRIYMASFRPILREWCCFFDVGEAQLFHHVSQSSLVLPVAEKFERAPSYEAYIEDSSRSTNSRRVSWRCFFRFCVSGAYRFRPESGCCSRCNWACEAYYSGEGWSGGVSLKFLVSISLCFAVSRVGVWKKYTIFCSAWGALATLLHQGELYTYFFILCTKRSGFSSGGCLFNSQNLTSLSSSFIRKLVDSSAVASSRSASALVALGLDSVRFTGR